MSLFPCEIFANINVLDPECIQSPILKNDQQNEEIVIHYEQTLASHIEEVIYNTIFLQFDNSNLNFVIFSN